MPQLSDDRKVASLSGTRTPTVFRFDTGSWDCFIFAAGMNVYGPGTGAS
jgi:hypothetical protein